MRRGTWRTADKFGDSVELYIATMSTEHLYNALSFLSIKRNELQKELSLRGKARNLNLKLANHFLEQAASKLDEAGFEFDAETVRNLIRTEFPPAL